jgi:leucyl aminopeptidase
MRFSASHKTAQCPATDCLVLFAGEKQTLSADLKKLDKTAGGMIGQCVKSGDFKGRVAQTLWLYPSKMAAKRLLLVGTGPDKKLSPQHFQKIMKALAATLSQHDVSNACIESDPLGGAFASHAMVARQIVRHLRQGIYQFTECKSKKTPAPKLKKVTLLFDKKHNARQINAAIKQGDAVADGVSLCRDLGNLPANICTPSYLAKRATQMAKKHKSLKTKVLNEKDMAKLGMGALLSVSNGSKEPAKLIIMEHRGAKQKNAKPIVLVGKGITFDAGGISLKPPAGMDEMKFDMCGAASVFGVIDTISALNLPLNVIGLVAASENLPSGTATKPGDIVKTMSGQTVEILNTDAEGRLVLCDALTYAERFKPEAVIDIATLTGAMVVAVGNHASGVMGNNDKLRDTLVACGEKVHDRAWPFPLWADYGEELKSNFADIANVGGRYGGSITAGCFLAKFTDKLNWVHMDIAGSAWLSGAQKGATGRPVPLLCQYLFEKAGVA